MKIGLEELKARSRECGYNPELIKIAKEAKSPTAAFDLAKKSFGDDLSKKCRYLAMIKRDYGKKVFEQTVLEIEKESKKDMGILHLRPLIQTAQRLDHIFCMRMGDHSFFDPIEIPYVSVIERFLENLDNMSDEHKKELLSKIEERGSAQMYIGEVKALVSDAKRKVPTDSYSIEKTVLVLFEYITFYGNLWGLPKEMLSVEDWVAHLHKGKIFQESEKKN